MGLKYELANGTFVDHETYLHDYKMLHGSFVVLSKLLEQIEVLKTQRGQIAAGNPAAREKAAQLDKKMAEKIDMMRKTNDSFLEYRNKLLPKCYHNDKAVLNISYLISKGKVSTLKEALAVYHELMHREEARDIYNSLDPYAKEAIAERERKKAAREKEMLDIDREIRNLQSQTGAYLDQAARSQRQAESSMTSVTSSYNNRKITEA